MWLLAFFFAWFAWTIVFATIMSVVKLITGYDWARKRQGKGEALLLADMYMGGWAMFIKLLE